MQNTVRALLNAAAYISVTMKVIDIRKFATTILAIIACTLFESARVSASESNYVVIADRILKTYASSWSELSPDKQKHWALRMYRISGDTVWYPAIKRDLQSKLATLRSDADSLSDSSYSRRRVSALVSGMDWGKRKNDARRLLFAGQQHLLVQIDLLYNLATVDDYRLDDSIVKSICQQARDRIQPKPLADFLSDTVTIELYGPQAANAVEYLCQLGLIDVREDFVGAYKRAFPDSLDTKLDDRQFADKVYGLTHIVIAASGYYQRKVEPREFQWALDYFRLQQNRILKRLSADVIAEVGLCFLLCGDSTGEIIDKCRKAVVKDFDRKTGLIVSGSGSTDVTAGEHRNILTYMLLRWPPQLFSGPPMTADRLH